MKNLSVIFMVIAICLGTFTINYTLQTPTAESIYFVEEAAEVYIDQEYFIEATVNPHKSPDKILTWSNSNEDIAELKVSNYFQTKATVIPKDFGTTTIKATTKNGLTATCKITVIPRAVTNVEISCEFTTIKTGSTYTLTSTLAPNNATLKTLAWTSSNQNVLTVTQEGTIEAIAEGTATIRATAIGGVYDEITFTVQDEIHATGVIVSSSNTNLSLNSTYKLTYTLIPANATSTIVSWESSDPDVMTVDENGNVRTKAVGSAVITITTSNGKTDTIYLNVPRVAATSINIGLGYFDQDFVVGTTYQLQCIVKPGNTTDKITWTSDRPDYVSVDQTGKVTVLQEYTGSVTITATINGMSDEAYIFYSTKI